MQASLSRKKKVNLLFWVNIFFLCAAVCSAFVIVYNKDVQRRRFMHYQSLQQQTIQMRVLYTQWLLEEGALSNPGRIARLARAQGMVLPQNKHWQTAALSTEEAVGVS